MYVVTLVPLSDILPSLAVAVYISGGAGDVPVQ
jgi:hypothetical protein